MSSQLAHFRGLGVCRLRLRSLRAGNRAERKKKDKKSEKTNAKQKQKTGRTQHSPLTPPTSAIFFFLFISVLRLLVLLFLEAALLFGFRLEEEKKKKKNPTERYTTNVDKKEKKQCDRSDSRGATILGVPDKVLLSTLPLLNQPHTVTSLGCFKMHQ
jgi:hypothetical protein